MKGEADLCLCFHVCISLFSHDAAHFIFDLFLVFICRCNQTKYLMANNARVVKSDICGGLQVPHKS